MTANFISISAKDFANDEDEEEEEEEGDGGDVRLLCRPLSCKVHVPKSQGVNNYSVFGNGDNNKRSSIGSDNRGGVDDGAVEAGRPDDLFDYYESGST